MLRKFPGAMARYDLLHHVLLHKTPRPIACCALLIGKQFFDCVVIERSLGHAKVDIITLTISINTVDKAKANRLGSAERIRLVASASAVSRIARAQARTRWLLV